DLRPTVHEPDGHGAVEVAPQDVALAVAVEVTGCDDLPVVVAARARRVRFADLRPTVHEPDGHGAVEVAPQDVALAVAVEVTRCEDLPGVVAARARRVRFADLRPTVHEPDGHRAVGVAPQDVALAVAVEVTRRRPPRSCRGSLDYPGVVDGATERLAADRPTVHEPDGHRTVDVAPQDVALAV